LLEVAPDSAMALAMAASISASLAPAGRYDSMMASSFVSSWRRVRVGAFGEVVDRFFARFYEHCKIWMASLRRAGESFRLLYAWMAALISRRTLRRSSSLARMASTRIF